VPAALTPVRVSLAACGQSDAGLGFDVTGDEMGAVYVREVFDSAPAALSGKIRPGQYVERFRFEGQWVTVKIVRQPKIQNFRIQSAALWVIGCLHDPANVQH